MILECSSAGDKRFSALYAEIEFEGVLAPIEHHYQSHKMFERCGGYGGIEVIPYYYNRDEWQKAKGKRPVGVILQGMTYPEVFDPGYLSQLYAYLWLKYLDAHPDLVEYAKGFDGFHDSFRGSSVNCQADCIRVYVRLGHDALLDLCKDVYEIYEGKE